MKTKSTSLALLIWALAATNGLTQPHITNQPPWLHVCLGSTATFWVGAEGTPPLSYQWFNGTTPTPANILSGETNATLVIANVRATKAYTAIITNSEGSVTSAQARVYLNTPFGIAQQPASATVETGATFTCSVTVTSQVAPSVQWYFSGQPLAGQTTTTLTINNVHFTNAGQYWLQVSNACASQTSHVAQLKVIQPGSSFTRVTTGPVVNDPGSYWGSAWVDYDNDGYIDLFVGNRGTTPLNEINRLYHNNGDGTFTRMSASQVGDLVGETNNWYGCGWGDYDNDGWIDVFVISNTNTLYRNVAGVFQHVRDAGVDGIGNQGSQWVDYDRDGWADLFQGRGWRPSPRDHNTLYHNQGDGSFTAVTNGPIYEDDVYNTQKFAWGDYDGDGWPDLVVADPAGLKTLLYRNQGTGTFERITNNAIAQDTGNPICPSWVDYDNDGKLDLYMGHWIDGLPSKLFHNEGNGQFTVIQMGEPGQNGPGAWGDYDNDGDLDLFINRGQMADYRNQFFENNGNGTFTELKSIAPATFSGRSHTAIWGDYDNDGFLDLFVPHLETVGNSLLYHNATNSNHWLMTKLEGTVANRAAIGTRVKVQATIFGTNYWQMRDIGPSTSDGQNDPRAHFGLGGATKVDVVRVEWPSSRTNRVTEWHNLAAGQILTLTEPTNDLPSIVTQPPWRTNCVGTAADFPVVAMGAPPLHYQWREGPMALTGATNATLEVVAGQANRQFTLVVSNAAGSVTSSPARLYVVIPITITSQPPPTMNLETGATFVVSVAVSGTAPSYQWYFDGQPLAGKTTTTLTIANVHSTNEGCYHVTTHNACGSVTSVETCLKVVEPGTAFSRMTNATNFPMVNDPGAYWGSAWVDYDKDGDVDLFVCKLEYSTASPTEVNRLYRNDGGGRFTRMTTNEVGPLVGDLGSYAGCTWGDYDNDGFVDVSIMRISPGDMATNVLYHNNGQGGFTRVLNGGPLTTERLPTQSLAWGDFDNDGWLDLFFASASRAIGTRMALYRNMGDGTFGRVRSAMQDTDALWTEVAAWGDYDGDGDLDLVVTDDGPATFFYRNEGSGQFTRITNAITLDTGFALVPAWADYDNDGRLDLFIGHYSSTSRLFHNEGGGQFARIEIGAADQNANGTWGDYDNDGDLDLMLGGGQGSDVRQQFFQNNGDGTFTELKSIAPATYVGRTANGVWGDYDNDGFLDLFVPHMRTMDSSLFYHNEGNSNHWLMVRPEGTVANRTAIGAKVRVLATIFGKTNWQMREISGGNRSQNDLRAHFGLGDATNVTTLRVEWPSGHVTEAHNIAANQILTIQEPPGVKCAGWDGTAMCLAITGNIGERYELKTSSDIAAPDASWIPCLTNSQTSRTILVTNASPLVPQRFYKATPAR